MTVHYKGIDSWHRPVFKGIDGSYYGALDKLFSHDATKKEVLYTITIKDLVYFGEHFDCEPVGLTPRNTITEIK